MPLLELLQPALVSLNIPAASVVVAAALSVFAPDVVGVHFVVDYIELDFSLMKVEQCCFLHLMGLFPDVVEVHFVAD